MNQIPEKPKTTKAQVDLIWEAVYNHLPSRLRWQDIKLNFVLGFMGLVLGLLAAVIILLVI